MEPEEPLEPSRSRKGKIVGGGAGTQGQSTDFELELQRANLLGEMSRAATILRYSVFFLNLSTLSSLELCNLTFRE